MTNKQIGVVLHEIGALLEIKGENPFKIRAYANAARRIETWEEPIEGMAAEGRLGDVPGLGPALVKKITELVVTGGLAYYDELVASIPEGLREMRSISGLGAKKVRAIHEHLGVTTLDELEYACREDRLAALEGFGAKTQARVLKGIGLLKRSRGHYLIHRAREQAEALVRALRACPAAGRVAVAGDVRRRMEVVRDIDVVVSDAAPEAVMEALRPFGALTAVEDVRVGLTLESGIPARIHIVPDGSFGTALYRWTGSEAHHELIARHAEAVGAAPVDAPDEEAFYQALGLPYIPPELREGTDEVAAAARRALPERLSRDDLIGVIHAHTIYSDGVDTVEAMANAARERGYRYIALCDHSRSAGYAHGLDIDRVRQQHDEIDALNAGYEGFRILKGIESDILPDGRLDYPEDVLATFDVVVASVHSVFNMSSSDMTDRIVRAIRNPFTVILGHPTGRLLLARDGYPVDIRRLIHEAVEHRVAIEVNANPHRLDLDWRHLRYARRQGAKISIGPDAHRVAELDYVDYGLGIARKGWLTGADVLNTMTAEALLAWHRS